MQNLNHTIRTFNRFELKYIIQMREAQEFRQALMSYLTPDEHGDKNGTYSVASLYFDSPGLRYYWEKINGIRFRRKLRIRTYQTEMPLTLKSPVFVEVKQRLNRVTQKRRVTLPYWEALKLCIQRKAPDYTPGSQAVMAEVMSMSLVSDLQPTSVVTYSRQALVGSELDIGLRVTFDKDLRFRTENLELADRHPGQFLFSPELVIMEIKVNERVPYWLTELVAQHNLNLIRVSKYCRSIEMAQMDMTGGSAYDNKIDLPSELAMKAVESD
ncbi:MAG: polyphosphate polymerase domain-containing protein [Anaerolineaceae bacterium]